MRCLLPLVCFAILPAVLMPSSARAQLLSPGPLSRDHAHLEGDAQCHRCHLTGRRVDARKCLSCHDRLRSRIRARKGLHGTSYRDRNCGDCHVEHIGKNSRLIRWPGGSKERFSHELTGWPLKGVHKQASCGSCHTGRSFLGLSRRCESCHEDRHKGRFRTQCQGCHTPSSWSDVRVEQFDHSLTHFELEGEHRALPCSSCHGTPPQYLGLKHQGCAGCHRKNSPHRGEEFSQCEHCHQETSWGDLSLSREDHPGVRIDGGHRRLSCARCHDAGPAEPPSKGGRCVSCHQPIHLAKFGRRCEGCHRTIRWRGLPRRVSLKAHKQTSLPLRGRHQKTKCNRCHRPEFRQGDRWRLLEFESCIACHEDRHDGAFASRNGGDCAQCHQETGFYPTSFGVEEHATTAFPLVGRHIAVPCRECHGDERPRLNFKVERSNCVDCHEDPHGGQFAKEMVQGGCAQCHTTLGWEIPNVNHDAWPLTGAHAKIACESCHTPSVEDRESRGGVTYRGVPRKCVGCHEDPHAGQFRLREPNRECEFCHETSSFEIEGFDHEKLTGHKLLGRHATLECASCHPTETLEGGLKVVRWRLGYRSCRSCHADPHRGGMQ